jgi:hypothetical protein
MDPVEVAARNAVEFFIDRISGHRGKTLKCTNLEFLVSWKGYSAKDDTWEPYKAVCKTQAFVDYCYANRLTSLVNKALRGSVRAVIHGLTEHWNLMQDSLLFWGAYTALLFRRV